MKRKNARNSIALYVAIIILVLSIASFSFVMLSQPLESRKYDVLFSVSDSVGFDINSSALTFGRIMPPGSSTRTIVVENPYAFPLKGRFLVSDNLADTIISPPAFYVAPFGSTNVTISVVIPLDYPYGNYSGKARLELRRSR